MNRISLLLIIVLSTFSVSSNIFAQGYGSDAALISINGNIAVLKCSGVDAKKKIAIEMAAKSAVYTYLISGIEGLNNGRPLIGTKTSPQISDYLNKIFNEGRYSVFIKSCIPDENASKNLAKTYSAVATVELYHESLYKDLVVNKIISKAPDKTTLLETQEEIQLPTIMVMPYAIKGQSCLDALQNNSDIRMAMSAVEEGFIAKGVEPKSFEGSLEKAEEYEARQSDLSLDDRIINNSSADVVVKVDISKDQTVEGLRVSLRLAAIETATGSTLASKSEISGRKRAGADAICHAMVKLIIDDFLKQISTRMAYKISRGNAIALNFTVDPNSAITMDEVIVKANLPLSNVIIKWIKSMAKDGRYHQKGRTATMLKLDEIQIMNKSAEGQFMDINDFNDELFQYLQSLNLKTRTDIIGNTINITIM